VHRKSRGFYKVPRYYQLLSLFANNPSDRKLFDFKIARWLKETEHAAMAENLDGMLKQLEMAKGYQK